VKKNTVAVLVKNQFGVLNRVTSMFRRRGFNIDSLTVSETESPEYSRITVTFGGEENIKDQLINQLYKLPDVRRIKAMDIGPVISREMLLIKLKSDPAVKQDVLSATEVFHGKIVDYTREAIIIELTGESRTIDEFIHLMREFTILEICRTGVIALECGANTILQEE